MSFASMKLLGAAGVKILIADDHAIVRQGLKQTLADEFGNVVVAEARTAQEVMDHAWKQEWDLAILDLSLPDRNGLEVLQVLKDQRRDFPILVLSMHAEEQYAARVFRAGAAGYITKHSAVEELAAAIRKVLAGGKYVSPALAETLAARLDVQTEKPLHERLSNREYQILCLIASGKTVSEIAEQFSLSIKTISTYRARVLEKMRMKNNAQLTSYAVQYRLVTPETL